MGLPQRPQSWRRAPGAPPPRGPAAQPERPHPAAAEQRGADPRARGGAQRAGAAGGAGLAGGGAGRSARRLRERGAACGVRVVAAGLVWDCLRLAECAARPPARGPLSPRRPAPASPAPGAGTRGRVREERPPARGARRAATPGTGAARPVPAPCGWCRANCPAWLGRGVRPGFRAAGARARSEVAGPLLPARLESASRARAAGEHGGEVPAGADGGEGLPGPLLHARPAAGEPR